MGYELYKIAFRTPHLKRTANKVLNSEEEVREAIDECSSDWTEYKIYEFRNRDWKEITDRFV